MIAVLLQSFGYRSMALLHILSAVIAFGPLFLYPGLRRAGESRTIASMHMRLTFPALVVLWVLGMGLAGMSQDAYKMSQLWLALALPIEDRPAEQAPELCRGSVTREPRQQPYPEAGHTAAA